MRIGFGGGAQNLAIVSQRRVTVLVSGPSQAREQDILHAEETGRLLAEAGAVVLTGGGEGVMEAACRGARAAGGTTIAVLPGIDADATPATAYVSHAVYTGMGNARNAILVRTADAVIAIGGGWGTLSEIALARNLDRPVVLLDSWQMTSPDPTRNPPLPVARDPREAVTSALAAVRKKGGAR